MNSDIKPIVDQIKRKISEADVRQLREQVSQGVEIGRQIVTAKAKDLLKQSKNSKVVNDVVIPFLESEQALKAIDTINGNLKLKNTPIVTSLLKLREDLIRSKVEQARTVDEVKSDEASTEETTSETTSQNETPTI